MYFMINSLLGLSTLAWAAPYTSSSNGFVPSTPLTLNLPTGNTGTAVADPNRNLRAFYQNQDSSIQVLSGSGFTNGVNYQESQVVPPGNAAIVTPLAAVLPHNDISFVSDIETLKVETYKPTGQAAEQSGSL